MSITIRKMKRGDIEAVYNIERKCFPYPFSESLIMALFFASPDLCFVIEEDAKIFGFLLGGRTEEEKELHILSISVLEDYRGKRYGRMLMEYFIVEAKRLEFEVIMLEVRTDNSSAILLYEKLGFQFVRTLRRYYEDNCDGKLYRLNLIEN